MQTFGDMAFATAGPYLWNNLPPPIREARNTSTFKEHPEIPSFSG
jgi:hypothetical protein